MGFKLIQQALTSNLRYLRKKSEVRREVEEVKGVLLPLLPLLVTFYLRSNHFDRPNLILYDYIWQLAGFY
jgi:hypothetical protein